MLLAMMTKMLALFLRVDEPAHFPPPLSYEAGRDYYSPDKLRAITELYGGDAGRCPDFSLDKMLDQ